MDYEILNDRQPNDEGFYEAIIRNVEGKPTSTFKAKTEWELIETLLKSQVNANREIARLRKPDVARTPLRVQPRDLSAADRLRLSTEITDPNKVVEAVDEIVTARQGIAPDKLGAEFARKSQEDQDEFYGREAQSFRDENPDFYPVPQNRDALFEELKAHQWDLTRNNLALAWENLKEKGDVVPWPEKQQTTESQNGNGNGYTQQTAQPVYSPRPRTIATTGLRNADASAMPPPPTPKKQKYTRADIERMSRSEYSDKLRSDPEFRRQVDAM